MSMGAVQHFYPNRDQIVAAMLEYVVNGYEDEWERVCKNFRFNGEERLLCAVDYLAGDILNQETRQFFFALWALSCHSKFAATLQDEMYVHHYKNMAAFVGAAQPRFSERQCLETAMQIVSLIEGMMLLTAPRAKHFSSRAAVSRMIKRAVVKLMAAEAGLDSPAPI
ncbi:MAG TPA: TetR family transcriptional regulator C-terminal domain-containing protein [Steroidobacteraceae bacterium]|nr:TetR family transcriptional regulator C-terminal domain-containing protein [Steroidobacteraceae bacterium]